MCVCVCVSNLNANLLAFLHSNKKYITFRHPFACTFFRSLPFHHPSIPFSHKPFTDSLKNGYLPKKPWMCQSIYIWNHKTFIANGDDNFHRKYIYIHSHWSFAFQIHRTHKVWDVVWIHTHMSVFTYSNYCSFLFSYSPLTSFFFVIVKSAKTYNASVRKTPKN